MTATGHAVIGTVIAATISIPALAIPIAICSHVFADLVPHWDAGTHKKEKTEKEFLFEAIIDVVISYIVGFLLVHFLFPQTNILYAFMIIFFAQLLDWLTAFYNILHWRFPPFTWFYTFSHETNMKLDKPWGIITQTAVCVALLVIGKM